MRRPGIFARQSAARMKDERYKVDDGVRAARAVGLKLLDMRRLKSEADQRVEVALERLKTVDARALEAELAAALEAQASIVAELKALEAETLAA